MPFLAASWLRKREALPAQPFCPKSFVWVNHHRHYQYINLRNLTTEPRTGGKRGIHIGTDLLYLVDIEQFLVHCSRWKATHLLTVSINEFLSLKMRAPRSHCFSPHMNNRHIFIWQLKKSKSWRLFWSYQLNSSANPAHLPQNWAQLAKLAKSAVLFSC